MPDGRDTLDYARPSPRDAVSLRRVAGWVFAVVAATCFAAAGWIVVYAFAHGYTADREAHVAHPFVLAGFGGLWAWLAVRCSLPSSRPASKLEALEE